MRESTAVLGAFALTMLLALPAAAQGPPADSLAVADIVRRFHTALEAGDSAAVLALLADDAVILEAGGTETRGDYRGHHLPADIRFAQAVPSRRGPIAVRVRGDVAWATSTAEVSGTFQERPVSSMSAELMVLSREADRWRIRAIHWSSRRRPSP